MKKSLLFIFILAFTQIALAQTTKKVKLGLAICQTGGCAATGVSSLRGIQIAVDEINQAGGILGHEIVLVVEDSRDADSPAHAVNAFKSLMLQPDLNLVIGPTWSNAGMPLVPLIKQKPNLIITSSSLGIPDFNEASDRIFNTWPHDRESSIALADWAIKNNAKTAGILAAQDPWTLSMAEEFTKHFETLGGKVLTTEKPLLSAPDVRPEISRIRASNPDFIVLGYWDHSATAARELDRLGWKGQLGAIQMDQEHLDLGGKYFKGLVYASFTPPAEKFVKLYKQRFNAAPGLSADNAYDTVYLYKRAIEAANSFETEKVKVEILKQKFDGVSGPIEFDAQGGITRKPFIQQVK